MNLVKIVVSIMILFVAVNLILVIYRFLNRKWREGLENATSSSVNTTPTTTISTSAPASASTVIRKTACPNGCKTHKNPNGDCSSLKKDKTGNFYKECYYECAGPNDPGYDPSGCKYSWECHSCGAFKVTGLWDASGNLITTDTGVQSTAPASIADVAKPTGVNDGTLDSDTAASYNTAVAQTSTQPATQTATQPATQTATPSSTQSKCNILNIHNESAHNSTYGKWFPARLSGLTLTQTQYEEAGRRFLNEESIKKGVQLPLILDSEAEVLGRLLWRVHLAAIYQNCEKNSESSVQRTMADELALMRKIYSIQAGNAASSLSPTASGVNCTTQPIQQGSCATTGVMTNTNSAAYKTVLNSLSNRAPIYNSGSSTGTYTGYTTDYKPRNPNLKPKPYNSIWDLF